MTVGISQVVWIESLGGGTSLPVAITVSAGSSLYSGATCDISGGSPTISIADGGGSHTAIDSTINDPGNQDLKTAHRDNVSAASLTVTATYSFSVLATGVCCAEIQGASSTPFDAHGPGQFQGSPGTGTDGVTSGTAQTPSAQPALVVALSLLSGSAGAAPVAGTGFTSAGTGWNIASSGNQARMISKRITSASAVQGLFTASVNSGHCTAMAVFLEAGGGGGGPSTDQIPLGGALAMPRVQASAARRYEVVAPIGALIVAGLSSVGWGPSTPLTARAVKTNPPAAQVTQPIGTGTFSLAKFPHSSAFGPPAPQQVVRSAPAVAQPVGTLIQASTLTSLGWLVIGTSSPAPASRLVISDGGSFNGQQISSLTSLGWLVCDAAQKSSLVAPRAQQPVGGESPLRPFVSTSFGWGASTPLPYDQPLVARQVSESSPTGTLFPASLPSAGWFETDDAVRPVVAPRVRPEPVQAHLGGPLLFGGTPWDAPALPRQATVTARVEPSAPVGALTPFVSLSTGWLSTESKSPVLPAPRAQDTQQPAGPLAPFVSLSTGWIVTPIPYDTPLFGKVVSESGPVGLLLTPQPFGWNSALEQAKPAPVIPRRVELVSPVGTPFAIALPSNGWLATDNPRTPLTLGKSAPTDPVGNLLVLPPLPSLSWLLAAPNPRTPYSSTRAVIVDPVGSKLPLPGALGPYWFLDQAPRQAAPTARVAVTDPIGTVLATLSSLGWLSPFEAPRAPVAKQGVQPSDPFRALAFGGAPWATVDVQPGRAAAARAPEASAPVGSLLTPATLPGIGWLRTEQPRGQVFPARVVDATAPVGTQFAPPALTSLGWQVVELTRARLAQQGTPFPTDPLSALQFGGSPWATLDSARRSYGNAAQQSEFAPVGSAFAGQLSNLGWQFNDAPAPKIVFPRVSPVSPIGLLIPPPVLPSMGFQTAMELPPKWTFVSRPEPSEPVGASFALGFTVAPARRCSPVFDMDSGGRVSPIFDESR